MLARWQLSLRRPSPAMVFWVVTVGVLALILIRNYYVFTTHIYEEGDFALNSFLVDNTRDGLQLVGNGSRTGFSHPGPVYLYVLSGGQLLFHDWLPIAASPYGGQFIGDAVLQSVLLGLVVLSIFRLTRSLVAATMAGSVIFAFAATHQMIGYVWFPCMYMSAFALLVVAAAAVAAGRTRELPLLVLAGGLLVHGHVAFILFVTVTCLVVVLGWSANHRGRWTPELRSARASLIWAGVLVVLFLVPLVLEVTLHYPGPWGKYWDYSEQQGKSTHSLGDSLRFLGHYWATTGVPIALFVIAGLVGIAALVIDHNAARRAYFAWGYGFLLLETALFGYYIERGIDALVPDNYYTGYFYLGVPMFLLAFAVAHATALAHDRLGSADYIWPARLVAVGFALGLVIFAGISPSFTDGYRGRTWYPQIVSALKADPERAGRPVVIDFPAADWWVAAGTIIQADRAGLATCVTDEQWRLPFTPRSMCASTAGHWQVLLEHRSTWDGAGQVIWSNADIVVVQPEVR